MQAATQPVATAPNEFKPDRDKDALKIGTRKVRVHVRNTSNLVMGQLGNRPPVGISDIWCYENEIDQLRAGNLETEPEKIEIARQAFESALAKQVAEAAEGGWDGEIPALIALIKSKGDPRINEAYERVLETTEHSLESTFHMLFGRGIKPLISFEVVGDPLPAPTNQQIEEERARMKLFTQEALGALLQAAQPNASAQAEIAALKQQIAELTALVKQQRK